jgi:hypothetical protein
MMQAFITLFATIVVGGIRFEPHACMKEPFCPTSLVATGSMTKTFHFDLGEAPCTTLDLLPVDTMGSGGARVIVAVAAQPGGSDVHFEATVISTEAGDPEELIDHIEMSSQDAFCIGKFAGEPGVLILSFIWGDESHYQPHRYRATRYAWNGRRFIRKSLRETSKKFASWRPAARALGYRCDTNVTEVVVGRGKTLANSTVEPTPGRSLARRPSRLALFKRTPLLAGM